MGTGLFSIGIGAMQNAQLGLLTTEHNISNSDTAGYSRQRAVQTTNGGILTGAGFVGQGATISTIERLHSVFYNQQINRTQSKASELGAYSTELDQIGNMLADANAGLSPALQDFFTGVNKVSSASESASLAARQTMVSSAQAMISRYQGLGEQLSQRYDSVNSQIQASVSLINSYSQQIATLNGQILNAQSVPSQIPNDLYDQRDQLVAELNQIVRAETSVNSNGTYNVFIGNGQQLVTGIQVTQLGIAQASADPSRLTIGLKTPTGVQELPESVVTGGALGGLLSFRNQSLDAAANALGKVAVSMALTFNAQHALGQDLQGKIAGDTGFEANFFVLPSPKVIANSQNPALSPTLNVQYDAPSYNGNFYTNLTGSDYRLQSDGTTLSLTRLSDNKQWTGTSFAALQSAIDISSDGPQGFNITSATFPPAGAGYLIQPTRDATLNMAINPTIVADPRKIAAAAPIRAQAGTSNTGNATISPGSVVTGYAAPGANAPITLTYSVGNLSGFSAANYPVTVTLNGVEQPGSPYASGNVTFVNGATISFSGMSFVVNGTPKDGDTFEIAKNTSGVSDNRNALLLAQLQSQNTLAGQTATYQGGYAQLVSDVGNKGREVQVTLSAQKSLLIQAQDTRAALSGVNLDEEAANLLHYQQAYQAAAKMIDIGSKLLDTILAIR